MASRERTHKAFRLTLGKKAGRYMSWCGRLLTAHANKGDLEVTCQTCRKMSSHMSMTAYEYVGQV